MFFVWIGLAAVLMKYFEVGPVAQLSWLWISAPLIAAFVWFEIIEPMIGMDKKKDDGKLERERKARIAAGFVKDPRAAKR